MMYQRYHLQFFFMMMIHLLQVSYIIHFYYHIFHSMHTSLSCIPYHTHGTKQNHDELGIWATIYVTRLQNLSWKEVLRSISFSSSNLQVAKKRKLYKNIQVVHFKREDLLKMFQPVLSSKKKLYLSLGWYGHDHLIEIAGSHFKTL